jgi:hypothetical protein
MTACPCSDVGSSIENGLGLSNGNSSIPEKTQTDAARRNAGDSENALCQRAIAL